MPTVIKARAIARRKYWIEEIRRLSGNFGDDSTRVEAELSAEARKHGHEVLLDHLRLCGDIPEQFDHDSSEEKLYSKYTDALLCIVFLSMGLKALVIKERADAADVEAFAKTYAFVADAKAFRLSRTAKNQKDFKIQAMDGWKRGKEYAMVVCPIYQLPTRASQIYQQASARNVLIFTYSHLAVLCTFAQAAGNARAEVLLKQVFEAVRALNPTKDAAGYWMAINRTILAFDPTIAALWTIEKKASLESVIVAKELALEYLAAIRERIVRMSHEQALTELLRVHRIESRIAMIRSIEDTGLLGIV